MDHVGSASFAAVRVASFVDLVAKEHIEWGLTRFDRQKMDRADYVINDHQRKCVFDPLVSLVPPQI